MGGSNVLSDTEFPMFASLIKEGGDEPFCNGLNIFVLNLNFLCYH